MDILGKRSDPNTTLEPSSKGRIQPFEQAQGHVRVEKYDLYCTHSPLLVDALGLPCHRRHSRGWSTQERGVPQQRFSPHCILEKPHQVRSVDGVLGCNECSILCDHRSAGRRHHEHEVTRTNKCTLSCAAKTRHTKCDFNVGFLRNRLQYTPFRPIMCIDWR